MDLRSLRYFVAVAEELHFGRAAARLHITQPPLSRCIRQLESHLGCRLLLRSPAGVSLTSAGEALYSEARALLAKADQLRARVVAAAGPRAITVGVLADSAEQLGPRLIEAYRHRHPDVHVHVREADLTDPTVGLRAGLVDVALTRAPFDDAGIDVRVLREDPVGVVLRTDDRLATRESLTRDDLAGRRWFRLPEDTDARWRAYWSGGPGGDGSAGPVVRTVRECLQSVLWNGAIGLIPIAHPLPAGLVTVPIGGVAPSPLVVAWASGNHDPLIHSFVQAIITTHAHT